MIKTKMKLVFMVVLAVGLGVMANRTEAAVNDSMQTAKIISMDSLYSDSLTATVDSRFYKFTLSSSGRVTIDYKAYMRCSDYYIYDSTGKEVASSTYNEWNSVTELYSSIDKYDLTKGTYYYCVKKYISNVTGSFNFNMKFESADESFSEQQDGSDNSMALANSIDLTKQYRGQLACNDKKDFYKFKLDSTCKLRIEYKAYIRCSNFYIYDVNGQEVFSKTYNSWDDVSGIFSTVEYVDLEQGTYYFCAEKYYNEGNGNYDFMLSESTADIKLNKEVVKINKDSTTKLKATLIPDTNEKVEWKSGDKTIASVNSKGVVTGKMAGYTVITATVGDELKAECVVYVKPEATKLKKIKITSKWGSYGYMTLKWKKIKNVSGYQIYYAKSSSGKYRKITETSSESTNINMKRKKTYYFKVRAYVYGNDKKVYGVWSNVKSIYVK